MSRPICSFTKFFISTAILSTVLWGQVGPPQGPPPTGQTGQPAQDQPDPEDRNHGVGRISLLNGDVSVRRADSGDYVAAGINAPLLTQDAIQTGVSSRAEVQFDFANRVRISANTEVRMADLTAGHYQMQISRGTITLSVIRDGAAEMEIDTPSVAMKPVRRGDYRIDVLDNGTSQITVREGECDIYSPRGTEHLGAGQTMMARGTSTDPEFQIVAAIGRDEWDVFNERRDAELGRSQSYKYVSQDIPGAEDLDNYGQWVSDPTYGNVWAPRVAPGWAPYRMGRWVWEDYYGWTWVSYDPWGWAPYHYGSWFLGSAGWCWYPGAIYGRPWYRPAVVGFFGFGGVGVGVGFGAFANIGWVPLAPFESFHRWYGRGFGGAGFGRNVNIVNNTNITNVYRNARVTNGVTGVGSHEFANGGFGRYSSVNSAQLQGASLMRGQVPVAPGNGSYRFNDRGTSVTQRAGFQSQHFFSRGPSTQQSTQRFGQAGAGQQMQQRGFAQAPANGGGFGRSNQSPGATQTRPSTNWSQFGNANRAPQGNQFNSRPPSASPNNGFNNRTAPSGGGGSNWQRFGAPNRSGFTSQPQPSGGSNWSRFGSPNTASRPSYPQQQQQSRPSYQIAPPMVRERGQNFGSSGRNFSSPAPSYRSAPAPSFHSAPAPSYHSAPAPSYHSSPAPSHSGGGGGGGGGSRGGGGGSRSESSHGGGGGGHRR